MDFQPNDLPTMELGEVRRVEFNLAPAVGTATLSSPEVTSDHLTIGSASVSGKLVRATITASQVGTHYVKCEALTSASETVIGVVRLKVKDSTECASEVDDYGR